MKTNDYILACKDRANRALKKKIPTSTIPRSLQKAIRYSVLNGGKRIRSAFIFATGEALGANKAILNDICVAIEFIHTFSLIHDDLPALDNDDLRRGKPTCHRVFGEATAILTGDILQSLAFEVLSKINTNRLSEAIILQMIRLLAEAIGPSGLAAGEQMDLEMTGHRTTEAKLKKMYQLKTGRLFTVSIVLAALASNCTNKKILNNLSKFSKCLGLAFQIHDDIIGLESDTKTLGKKQGADLKMHKPIYPVCVGMKKSKDMEKELYKKSLMYLKKSGIEAKRLKNLAAFVIERNY